jgi:hypothetical protein
MRNLFPSHPKPSFQPHTHTRKQLVLAVLFGVVAFVLAAPAFAQQACYGLFRKRDYSGASNCFMKEAKKLGANPTGSKLLQKGRLMRNAAISLDRGAKNSSPAKAVGYKLRAITILQQYLKQKLYGNSSTMKGATNKLLQKLQGSIGYARISIVTNHPKAKACITSKSVNKCNTGTFWNSKVLPGAYQIVVTYPLSPPVTRNKSITAAPRTQRTHVFTPPVKKLSLLSVVTNDAKATLLLKSKKLKAPKTHTGSSWTTELSPGPYQLMVIYPGQAPLKKTFTMQEGKPQVFVFTKPGPPVVVINTTPIYTQVFINGKYRGNTGIRLKLKPGTIKLELKRGCYVPFVKTMTVKANQEYAVSEILKRDPAYLAWKTKKKSNSGTVIGVSVLIAGVVIGGVGGLMYGLSAGKHSEAIAARPSDFGAYQQLAGENNTYVTVGHIGAGLGAVGIGTGVFLLATQSSNKPSCQVPLADEE